MDVPTLILYSIAGLIVIFPPALASLPVVFKNTAFHAVLQFYLPTSWMQHEVLGTVICSTYLAYLFSFASIQADHIILSMLVVAAESKNFLETSYIHGPVYKRTKSFQSSAKYESNQRVSIHKAVKAYRITFLIWREL